MKKLCLLFLSLTLILSACTMADEGAARVSDFASNEQAYNADSLDSGNAAELLSDLRQLYPIESISDSATAASVEELLRDAIEKLELSTTMVVGMSAILQMDAGESGLLTETVESSFRCDGVSFEAISKLTTQADADTYVLSSTDTYVDGWYYSSQTYTAEGTDQPVINRFKLNPFSDQYIASVRSALGMDAAEISRYADLLNSADTVQAGRLADGSIALLGTNIAQSELPESLESLAILDDYRHLLTEEAIERLQTAVVIDSAGQMTEIYVNLPLTAEIDEESAAISLELKLTIVSPATVEIVAPAEAEDYPELEEEYVFSCIGDLWEDLTDSELLQDFTEKTINWDSIQIDGE